MERCVYIRHLDHKAHPAYVVGIREKMWLYLNLTAPIKLNRDNKTGLIDLGVAVIIFSIALHYCVASIKSGSE